MDGLMEYYVEGPEAYSGGGINIITPNVIVHVILYTQNMQDLCVCVCVIV